jgi:chorismate mutase
VEEHCPPGSDSDSFGESVTADVDALLSIQQRINLGLLVAESKFRASPDAYVAAKDDPARIRSMLVNKDREARVLQAAERLAHHYEVDPAAVTPLFEWMIAMTVEVEVSYLRMRGGQGATGR